MTRLLLSILCVMLSAMAFAQDEPTTLRPVTSSYTYEIGGATLANTYLTPLKYKGWDMALNYERMQAMKFNPEKWVMRLTAGIDLNRTDNPAKNATMWRLVADFSWGMTYRFKLPHNITLAGGGSTSLDLGCVYNARNGTNPVAVEAAWTVNLTGYASWNVKIGRLPVTLRYQPTIPLTGVFFSPDYGGLFYEIYLGNHCAWWGNYFRMENLVTADMHLGATSLRVGFRNNILSTSINDITTRTITYSAVIGVTTEWISLNPSRKADNNARIISALY